MLPKIPKGHFSTSVFWAYKGPPEPKKAKVQATPSQYSGVTNSSFSGPFGSGTSTLNKATNSIDATATLSPELQNSANLAQSGLTNNLAYINRNPEQQVNFATSGQDPYYNVLAEQANQAFDSNLGRLRLQAFKGGGLNSTAAGGAYGNLAHNKNLYDNQILLNALQYGNQNALQGAQANLGAIGGLAQLVYPLQSAANAQLNTALQSKDRADAATVAARNQAEANYAQAMNEYSATKNAGMGSGIGSMVGAGLAIGAAPFTGGASLALLPAAMSLGGKAGGMIQGQPTQYSNNSSNAYIPNFGSGGGFSNPLGAGSGLGAMFNTSGINGLSGDFGNFGMAVA